MVKTRKYKKRKKTLKGGLFGFGKKKNVNTTRKETKKFENLTVEYIDNQDILDNGIGDLRSCSSRQLKKRQIEIY